MNKVIAVSIFSCLFLFTDYLPLSASSNACLEKEVSSLKHRLELVESQQRTSINQQQKILAEYKEALSTLKREVEMIRSQKLAVPTEFAEKIDNLKRNCDNSKEIEHILIKYGNNVDGMTPLHYAIKSGDLYAVTLLIANGADVNSRDTGGIWNFTALTRAVCCNQLEIATTLLANGANINLTVTRADTNFAHLDAMYYAAFTGNADIVNLLIENGANLKKSYSDYGTPLHVAAKASNYEAVVALVTAGASVNATIQNGSHWKYGTPLDYAANNLTYKDNPQNLELVKYLVEHGATRTVRNDVGCSVINGYLKSVSR